MVFLTGSSGFIGSSLINSNQFGKILKYRRGEDFNLDKVDIVFHFAGKAHDLKNTYQASEYYKINTDCKYP